jgi:hypothetical protein
MDGYFEIMRLSLTSVEVTFSIQPAVFAALHGLDTTRKYAGQTVTVRKDHKDESPSCNLYLEESRQNGRS